MERGRKGYLKINDLGFYLSVIWVLLHREYMGPGMNCERILIEKKVCNTCRAAKINAYSSLQFTHKKNTFNNKHKLPEYLS